jgi:DNA-binding PadR family transcriptional regulator
VLVAGTHFGHREAYGIVVDPFWNRDELEEEFRVEVEDRRDGARFVLSPTTGREALQAFYHPFSIRAERLAMDISTEYNTQYDSLEEPSMSVPHALLALLSEGPKYGLRLQNEFESRTGEVWPLNVGQVYTTLQRLERDGLVETDDGEGERSQKRYRITSAGTQDLADWLRTPPDLVPPPRDELVIKVLVALQVSGTDIHEILQVHRRHAIEVMQRYTQVKAAAGEDDVALALVTDAELFRLEAIVRWLDAADVRLKQLPTPAPAPVGGVLLEPTPPMEVSQ